MLLVITRPRYSIILHLIHIQAYTLRNEGFLAALKEPLWHFCETRSSFDDVGFF